MSLMAALGLPDGDQTLAPIATCSFCGKSEQVAGKLTELKRHKKLVCDDCVGQVANVLDDLQTNDKKHVVPDHD